MCQPAPPFFQFANVPQKFAAHHFSINLQSSPQGWNYRYSGVLGTGIFRAQKAYSSKKAPG
jgi:hypothetical protein